MQQNLPEAHDARKSTQQNGGCLESTVSGFIGYYRPITMNKYKNMNHPDPLIQ
jgi:hypothetical protein